MVRVGIITSTYARHADDYAVPWMRESVAHLRERGHDVTVIAPSFRGLGDHAIDGVDVRRFRYAPAAWETLTHEEGAPSKVRSPLFRALVAPYLAAGKRAARRVAREKNFDVIHVHWPFPHGVLAQAAANTCGAAVVANCHGAELALARRQRWIRPLLSRALTRADVVLANSSHTAGEVTRLSGRTADVVPFGSTVEAREPRRTRNDVPVILFTGRLIRRKGVEYLLAALPRVLEKHDVRVVITGDGDRRSELEAIVRKLDLGHIVNFLGFVSAEKLRRLYEVCDVYVLPSITDDRGDTEGLGVTSIEAFQYRRPVVATNVGGIVDVVRDGETGVLVPEKDLEALAAAITRLLDHPEQAKTLGEAGFRFAQEYFGWDRITDRIEAAYQRALDHKFGPPGELDGRSKAA